MQAQRVLNSVSDEVSGGIISGGSDAAAYHSVGGENSAKKIQSVLDGIDISLTSLESRFGQGFYAAAQLTPYKQNIGCAL